MSSRASAPRVWTRDRAAHDRNYVRFYTLGSLEIWKGGRECALRTPKVLQVLGMLLVRANRTVPTESMLEELWGENPPRSALTTIQTYIYQLRRLIEREGLADAESMLATQAPGYVLRVDPEQLDLEQFWILRRQGLECFRTGDHEDASHLLRGALNLWTERPLANVRLGSVLEVYVTDLQEQYRNTLQFAIESEMALGLHRDLIGELRSLTSKYPLDEWFYQQLMRALERSGRRSDALRVYRILQSTLSEELGIDPSAESHKLYCELLR
ncbi:AfsR/SARP family transcriptional regulator [Saccharomonospora saliphila]|uniref:AfsR/SARP family transcriptional regulator n=1 Tax=Saccharomonospora saliphila TaxID=369829 RepID=UPI000662A757|nr:AfsR/SARP family transcriptional regulator [Saccharomonospora saliphila]